MLVLLVNRWTIMLQFQSIFQGTILAVPFVMKPSFIVVGLALMKNPSALLLTTSLLAQVRVPNSPISQQSSCYCEMLQPIMALLLYFFILIFSMRMQQRSFSRSPRKNGRISAPQRLFEPPSILGLSINPSGLASTLFLKTDSSSSLRLSNSHSPTLVLDNISASYQVAYLRRTSGLTSSVWTRFMLANQNSMGGMEKALLLHIISLAAKERSKSPSLPNLQSETRQTVLQQTTATFSSPKYRSPSFFIDNFYDSSFMFVGSILTECLANSAVKATQSRQFISFLISNLSGSWTTQRAIPSFLVSWSSWQMAFVQWTGTALSKQESSLSTSRLLVWYFSVGD